MGNYMISSGSGTSSYRLVAFDNALIDAGISDFNLVRVSSILPPDATLCNEVDLEGGSFLHVAYATVSSNRPGERIATAIAVAIPNDSKSIGVIMEASGSCAREVEEEARAMVIEAMSNHQISIGYIESSSVEGVVNDGWLSLISAIALW